MKPFSLDHKSALPPYQQVLRELKLQIMSGFIPDGELLPSIRDLARYLKLNPNTVAKAYYSLESEGLVACRQGSGCRARSPRRHQDNRMVRQMAQAECRLFLEKAFALGLKKEEILDILQGELEHEQLPAES